MHPQHLRKSLDVSHLHKELQPLEVSYLRGSRRGGSKLTQ